MIPGEVSIPRCILLPGDLPHCNDLNCFIACLSEGLSLTRSPTGATDIMQDVHLKTRASELGCRLAGAAHQGFASGCPAAHYTIPLIQSKASSKMPIPLLSSMAGCFPSIGHAFQLRYTCFK